VIGGLLSQYLGWRAIFWFLLILGGIFMVTILTFFRETNRSIVGDGSIPPQRWNRSLFQLFWKDNLVPNRESLEKKVTGINPLASLRVLASKENFIVCIYGGLLFAGFSSVTSVFASQLQERYNYNEVQVGLCYLPIGVGSFLSRWTTAKLIDWNFKREAEKQGKVLQSFRLRSPLTTPFLPKCRPGDCQKPQARHVQV
jgi:predicted MFS family arabinose efflux permease